MERLQKLICITGNMHVSHIYRRAREYKHCVTLSSGAAALDAGLAHVGQNDVVWRSIEVGASGLILAVLVTRD